MRGGPKDGPNGGSPDEAPAVRREAARFHESIRPEELARPVDDPLIGETINDRYEILGRIGGGGMGNVYIALDRSANTKVAMKVLNEESDRRYKWSERFTREAKAAVTIDHPNVIEVFELGSFGDRRFCVMEYLEGDDLFKKLEREGKFSWERAKMYLLQICDALEAAHNKGVIHRDMKPANIVVVNNLDYPLVKVLDFGLAKIMDAEDDNITRDGLIMGTPKYMAPEQAFGGKNYDHRADIYALGAIMYEMLTGRPPFQSDAETERERIYQVLIMQRERPPVPPSAIEKSLPKDVEAVILRAMSKDPAKRFQTAGQMREAMMACPPAVKTAREAFPELFAMREGNGLARPSRAPPQEDDSPRPFPPAETAEEADRRTFEGRLEKALHSMPELPKGRRRWGVRAALLLAAAAAGYGGYHYRGQIREAYDGLVRQEAQQAQTSPRRQEAPQPAPSQPPAAGSATPAQASASAGNASTFEISIDSDPRGASVFDVTGGANVFLGGTPLRLQVARGEHTLMIRHRGFISQRKTVNPDRPGVSATLYRPPRPAQPAETNEAGPSDQQPPPSDSGATSGQAPRE